MYSKFQKTVIITALTVTSVLLLLGPASLAGYDAKPLSTEKGGTGQNISGTFADLVGTTDQVTVTNGTACVASNSNVTLSSPQSIATSSSPTFNDLGLNGDLLINTTGKGIDIAEGSNARMGTATLSSGAATVSTTAVGSNSRIFLTSQSDGGTPGFLRVTARTAGTSFTITSSSGSDTSTVAWIIFDPAS